MTEKQSKGKRLEKKLAYKRKCFWEKASNFEQKQAYEFSKGYCNFLDEGRTERKVVDIAKRILIKNGFVEIGDKTPKNVNKLYKINRGKNIAIAKLGKQSISRGFNLIVAHIDSPRVDLKQVPLYEDSNTGLALMHTHYYGGIKKYQWMSIPLAIYGVVVKENGEKIEISIGDKKDDPVFTFADLLIHLSKEQYEKKIGEAIDADKLILLFGSIPYPDKDMKDKIKLNCLNILQEKYGISEEDFISAELEIVPAFPTRDVGIDRSMIGGYGHDDRICAYSSLKAILDLPDDGNELPSIVFLADKEEIGSEGNTGARSSFIWNFISDIIDYVGEDSSKIFRKVVANSNIFSADVNVAVNPAFSNLHEKQNAALIGYGVCLTKFTGARGKSGANDANAEFVAKIRSLFNKNKIVWQTGELGKVDIGGGGTIAKFMAEYGANVIDCGTPIIAMHSPFEIASKGDLFSTYKAYKTFFTLK